jgi:3'-5' exoribonuclease
MMVQDKIRGIENFPAKVASELMHCILSHHGELEYGSPKKPALAEAVALSLADNADAKLETMKEIMAGATSGEWLGFNRLFDSNLRPTTKC